MYTLSVNSVSDSNSWLFRKYILHGCSVHQWKKCVITMLRHSKNLILQHSSNNTCCSSLPQCMNPTITCPLECGILLQPVDDNSDCCINNNVITQIIISCYIYWQHFLCRSVTNSGHLQCWCWRHRFAPQNLVKVQCFYHRICWSTNTPYQSS